MKKGSIPFTFLSHPLLFPAPSPFPFRLSLSFRPVFTEDQTKRPAYLQARNDEGHDHPSSLCTYLARRLRILSQTGVAH